MNLDMGDDVDRYLDERRDEAPELLELEALEVTSRGAAIDDGALVDVTADAACAVAAYLQTGADRDMHRSAERDGLRVVAWLARHLAAGDDPLKIVVQLARDARWDVDPADVAWADGDADEPEDEATP